MRRAAWLAATAAAVLAAAVAVAAARGSHSPAPASAFAWLHPELKPHGWRTATTSSGSKLAYPPGWQAIHGDVGTASAAPAQPGGVFVGYLNATPQAGNETLANWSHFRVEHVAEEGARHVRLDAAAHGLQFLHSRGSCVVDSYSTSRTRFREIACIVTGAHRTTVVVGAAPVRRWRRSAPVLEHAIDSFSA